MLDLVYKLKEKEIFKMGSMIESSVQKFQMGSPINLRTTLRVREMHEDYCIADDEYAHSDSPMRKILFLDIITIDGMKPGDLAAVYGLGPKTSRFKRSRNNK